MRSGRQFRWRRCWDTTLVLWHLTRRLSLSETVSDGQFDGRSPPKGNEAPKGSLRMVGNHSQSVKV